MNISILNIPKIEETRGNLSVIEKDVIPFEIKRVYYLYDVPSSAQRGGHAHKDQSEFLIALSGSFDVVLNDGKTVEKVTLNKPDKGLLIKIIYGIFNADLIVFRKITTIFSNALSVYIKVQNVFPVNF